MDYFDVLFAKTNGVSSSTCYNEIEAMLEATVGHSSKNLLEITATTSTVNEITFTVDKTTGTITATNANSPAANRSFIIGAFTFKPNKRYTLSGCPSGGGNTSYRLYAQGFSGSDNGNGVTYEVSEETTANIRCQIISSNTVETVVFKPMMRDTSISDDTFEPYVTPTDEKKQDKPITLDSAVLTFNIAEIQSKYETLKFVVEYTMDEITTIEYNVVEVPTFIFGRGDTSYYKILTFSAEYARDNFDAISFTESGDNVTVNPYTASSQNIIKIIGIPK